MKLTQIALRNFRSAQNLSLDLSAPRVYICGRNGVGKSSVKDGIRWALRGLCQTTDAKGLGWEALVPSGTTTLSAGVVLEGIGGVERTYKEGKRTLQLEGRDNDITSTQGAIYDLMKTTPEFLDAVLETDYFLHLSHADAKAIVLGLLNVRIPVGEESLSLAQVDARYKQAFQDRTGAKARQKAHLVPNFQIPPEGLMPKPEEIKERLDAIRKELQGLVATSGQSSGKRAVLEAQLATVESRPVYQPEEAPNPDEVALCRSTIARLEEEAERFSAAQQIAARPAPVAPAAQGSEIEARIQTLKDHKSKNGCVLDSGVPCETATIVFTNRVKFYRSQQAVATESAPVEAPSAPVATFDRQRLTAARARLQTLQGQQDSHDRTVKANLDRANELDALTAQLKSLEPSSSPVDNAAAIDTLQARIAKGEKVLEHAGTFWRQHEAHAKAVATKTELDADVDRLESLCQTLGPNGAKVQALEAAIGAFEEQINVTTVVFGWKVTFALDPWTVHVNGRVLDAYSESEQFRIGIAVQLAVAATSGLGFLVVDRLDMLDLENRNKVTGMLLERTDGIDQILILATREPDQKLPQITGLKAYRLAKDGQKTIIAEAA